MGGRRWVKLGIISKGLIEVGAINSHGRSKVMMVMLNTGIQNPGIAAVWCMQLKDVAVIPAAQVLMVAS